MNEPDINKLDKTIAVLETKMEQITEQVKDGFSNNSKEHREIMDTFQKAIDLKADKYDVDTLVENQKWIVKLIIGIVTTAIVGLVLKTSL
jgi:fructose-1,6-bisphosphatase